MYQTSQKVCKAGWLIILVLILCSTISTVLSISDIHEWRFGCWHYTRLQEISWHYLDRLCGAFETVSCPDVYYLHHDWLSICLSLCLSVCPSSCSNSRTDERNFITKFSVPIQFPLKSDKTMKAMLHHKLHTILCFYWLAREARRERVASQWGLGNAPSSYPLVPT
jgi:hypothetical protein